MGNTVIHEGVVAYIASEIGKKLANLGRDADFGVASTGSWPVQLVGSRGELYDRNPNASWGVLAPPDLLRTTFILDVEYTPLRAREDYARLINCDEGAVKTVLLLQLMYPIKKLPSAETLADRCRATI